MATRLTDRQKKKIIADYVQLGSYNAVAKMHGVSPNTVSCMDEFEIIGNIYDNPELLRGGRNAL